MFDRILTLFEIVLLIWIVYQGEWVKYYEKETWRMNAERFEERKQWRLQKKQQQLKKEIAPKTNDFKLSTASPSLDKTNFAQSKTTDVKSVA